MTDQPPKQPQQSRTPTGSLQALVNESARVLIPISPTASIESIVEQVGSSGAREVELLVPNGTRALQTVAGSDRLRQAADGADIRVTLYTADEATIAAAQVARLDIIPVRGTVAAPPTTARAATPRPAPRSDPTTSRRPAGASDSARRSAPAPQPPQSPKQLRASSATQRQAARPPQADDVFLLGLEAWEQSSPAAEPGRLVQSDEGAVLWDTPGEVGVRRPANDDADWEAAFGAMASTMSAEDPDSGASPTAFGSDAPAEFFDPAEAPAATPPRRRGRALLTPRGRSTRSDQVVDPDAATPPARRLGRVLLVPLGLLILVALIAGGWFLFNQGFGRTTPTLQLVPPPTANTQQRFTNIVIPLGTQPVTDTAAIAVNARVLDAHVQVKVDGTAEVEVKTPIGLARGVITLRNTTTQPVEIPAGTAVTANGIEFRFDRTVIVDAATRTFNGETYGQADAFLTATTPGAQGNLPAGTITRLPGYEAALLVEQSALSGGSDQDVRIVRVEDVNRVLPAAMSRLYATGLQALQLRTADAGGYALAATTITPTMEALTSLQGVEYAVLPPIGHVTSDGTFTLEARARFQAVAEPAGTNAGIAEQLTQAVKNRLVSTNGVDPRSVVTLQSWTLRDQTLIAEAVVQPPGDAPRFPEGFLEQVQQDLRGMDRAAAEQYLEQLEADRRIAEAPALDPLWQTIPPNLRVSTANRE